ncbi:hypothetical protein [Nocardia huaxiensis]|uniref:DUF3592 domain-containing protein n=1 Tax=Nocardia huaxiensis TaxID=2755382 RepID=A0A7D6VC07_9NOCA|nr:hypothetical protein [Nocardia huaxiensis]QLY30662.1 hypothetical protein H0264_37115 [Nocardia huaxiensis]UFS95733.1 hypothetical protein LPY97_34555 [Nocardia huaxiensis]
MSRKNLVGGKTLLWMIPVALGALLVGALGFNAGWWVGVWLDLEPLGLITGFAGVFVAIQLWILLLGVAWRQRRDYLRRAGAKTLGTVSEVRYRKFDGRHIPYSDTHRVRVHADFTHPETGEEYRIRKEYRYPHWRESTAKALLAQFPAGTHIPLLVRGNYAAFDIPERPVWADIW